MVKHLSIRSSCCRNKLQQLDMFEIAKVVAVMKALTAVLILAQPKAGLPELKNGKSVFNLSPYDFVQGISEFLDAGAKIASGC